MLVSNAVLHVYVPGDRLETQINHKHLFLLRFFYLSTYLSLDTQHTVNSVFQKSTWKYINTGKGLYLFSHFFLLKVILSLIFFVTVAEIASQQIGKVIEPVMKNSSINVANLSKTCVKKILKHIAAV